MTTTIIVRYLLCFIFTVLTTSSSFKNPLYKKSHFVNFKYLFPSSSLGIQPRRDKPPPTPRRAAAERQRLAAGRRLQSCVVRLQSGSDWLQSDGVMRLQSDGVRRRSGRRAAALSTAPSRPSETEPETPLQTEEDFLFTRGQSAVTSSQAVLTVREGAAAHRLVQDGHQEHVTVLKVRLHFVDGLDPERDKIHKYI